MRSVPDFCDSFDHIQPRCRSWRELHVEARMRRAPILHDQMLVLGVVAGDQVERLVLGPLASDLAQEFRE